MYHAIISSKICQSSLFVYHTTASLLTMDLKKRKVLRETNHTFFIFTAPWRFFSCLYLFIITPGSLGLYFNCEPDDNSSGETEGCEGNKRNETDRQKECSFQDCSHQCHVCSGHPSLLSSYGGKNKLEKNTNLSQLFLPSLCSDLSI